MIEVVRPALTAERVKDLALNTRLVLHGSRAEAIAPVVEQIFGMLDDLDSVGLGETPPSFSFRANWK